MEQKKSHKKQVRGRKREQILMAAAEVFASKGFAASTVGEIAEAAAVGKGTVYEYFSSKEELFFGVFEWMSQQSSAVVSACISFLSGTASDKLREINKSLLAYWQRWFNLYPLCMEFWSASASSRLRERFKGYFRKIYQEHRELIADLIAQGIQKNEFRQDVDPKANAAALVGAWDAIFLQAWFEEEFDLQGTLGEFLETLLRGMQE